MKAKISQLRKLLLLTIIVIGNFSLSEGQIFNGSFENGSGADLSGWQWTCGAQSEKLSPAGSGDYCIRVLSGNTQGCWPGYAYQKLPSVKDGQACALTGWAFAQTSQVVGLYSGKINKGVITLLEGDTTSSPFWKELSVKTVYRLAEGDTALVVLYGGLTGGPVQGYGFFDLIDLQLVTIINTTEQDPIIRIFPNPVSNLITIKSERELRNATFTIIDVYGRTVKQITNISGKNFTLEQVHLPDGLYVVRLEMDDTIIAMKKLIIND